MKKVFACVALLAIIGCSSKPVELPKDTTPPAKVGVTARPSLAPVK